MYHCDSSQVDLLSPVDTSDTSDLGARDNTSACQMVHTVRRGLFTSQPVGRPF